MDKDLPLTLKGRVTHGNHLGSTIDIPTANILIDKNTLKDLAYGVYFSLVYVDSKPYKAVTNVGTKPTIKDDSSLNAESFIFDFDGDLYDKDIEVKLLKFSRPEQKFASFEELSSQMKRDLDAARAFHK